MAQAFPVVRKMDRVGRLTIPSELCKRLGWKLERTPLTYQLDMDTRTVIIAEYEDGCWRCGRMEHDGAQLVAVRGDTKLCRTCLVALTDLADELAANDG